MSYTLSVGGEEQAYTGQDLGDMLAEVADESIEFLILTRDASEEYTQAAGAHGRLIVEQRVRVEGAWRHSKGCQRGASSERLPPRVPGYEGYAKRELLEIDTVAKLFEAFGEGQASAPELEWLDVSAEMGLDDDSPEDEPPEDAAGSGSVLSRLFSRLRGRS